MGDFLILHAPSLPTRTNLHSQQCNSYQPSKHSKDSTQKSKCISDEYSFYNTKSQSRIVIYRHPLYRIFKVCTIIPLVVEPEFFYTCREIVSAVYKLLSIQKCFWR